jgi:MFS transporter, DHA1 family, multidrug resistance protein
LADNRTTEASASLVILLAALAAMNALSVEIILPAVVPISVDLSVGEKTAAMLIGAYFLAYAFGQMIWGLLSDAFGRKPMLLLGMTGFLLASIGAALAPDFNTLLAFRLAQGVLGASPIIANAIVRDLSSGTKAARTMSVLAATTGVAPLLAPVLGSGLLVLFSWRAIFAFLAVLSAVLIVTAAMRLPETLAQKQAARLHPKFIMRRTAELLGNRQFRSGALVMSITFAGFASVLTLGSIVAKNAFHIAPEAFGSVYAIAAVFVVTGVLLARALLKTRSLETVGAISMGVLGMAVVFQFGLALTTPSFPAFWGGVAVYMLAFGLVYPTFTSYALEAAHSSSGFGASLIGAMNMLFGFLSSLLVTWLYDGSHRAISITMVLLGGLAIAIFLVLHPRRS